MKNSFLRPHQLEALARIEALYFLSKVSKLILSKPAGRAERQLTSAGFSFSRYEIGRHIVEHEQQGKGRAAYGHEVLNRLSEKLIAEFGKGFSRSNLEYMRRFYLAYSSRRNISQTASGKFLHGDKSQIESGKSRSIGSSRPFCLSWSHYVFLIGIKNPSERDFYEREIALPL